MIKKETDRQNYNILAGEGDILRILKEIDKAENWESIAKNLKNSTNIFAKFWLQELHRNKAMFTIYGLQFTSERYLTFLYFFNNIILCVIFA